MHLGPCILDRASWTVHLGLCITEQLGCTVTDMTQRLPERVSHLVSHLTGNNCAAQMRGGCNFYQHYTGESALVKAGISVSYC